MEVDIAGLNNVMSFLGVLQNENKSYFKRTEGGHILNLTETGPRTEGGSNEDLASAARRGLQSESCSESRQGNK